MQNHTDADSSEKLNIIVGYIRRTTEKYCHRSSFPFLKHCWLDARKDIKLVEIYGNYYYKSSPSELRNKNNWLTQVHRQHKH